LSRSATIRQRWKELLDRAKTAAGRDQALLVVDIISGGAMLLLVATE